MDEGRTPGGGYGVVRFVGGHGQHGRREFAQGLLTGRLFAPSRSRSPPVMVVGGGGHGDGGGGGHSDGVWWW